MLLTFNICSSGHNNWENAKIIIEFLSSFFVLLGIIIGSWKACTFFKYKNDSSIRDLYINNALQVEEILGKFYANAMVGWEDIDKLNKAYREATLYLHKDIVKFIEILSEYLCELIACNHQLQPLPVCEEKSELCEKIKHIELKIDAYTKNFFQLYRKQILQDDFEINNLKFWNKDICKK